MKRLAFLTLEYPPMVGGAGRYLSRLVDFSQGSYKEIWVPAGLQYAGESIVPVDFFYAHIWPRWLRGLFFTFRRIRKNRITHLICNNILPLGTIAYIASLLTHVRYVIIIHGMDITVPLKTKSRWKIFLLREITRRADAIIVNSHFTQKYASKVVADTSKIFIIPPPAYCTPERSKEELPPFAGVLNGRNYILSVGRLVKRKNYDMVLNVARAISKDKPDVLFVIAGSGPNYAHLLSRIKNEHLESNVHLYASVNDSQLSWLYRHCAFHLFIPLLLPNGDSEGFGIVALEACAFGKATIASRMGGASDIIEHGVNGLLVDPTNEHAIAQACLSLLSDETRRSLMESKAKNIFESQFSEEKAAHTLASVLGQGRCDVSVIIPAYNSEKTIYTCLESLQNQTCAPKEIIVVNDGSTDRTADLLKSWSGSRITVIQQKNSGAPAARNNGAKNATGSWLLFLDSDIVMRPQMLQTLYRLAQTRPDVDFVYSRFYFGWKKFSSFPFNPELLRKMNYIHTSSLIRKSAFPGFDESLKRHQDWDLWLTMVSKGSKGLFCDRYLYRIQPQKFRISTWIPSFMYKLPFAEKVFRSVKAYKNSANIVRVKHNLK